MDKIGGNDSLIDVAFAADPQPSLLLLNPDETQLSWQRLSVVHRIPPRLDTLASQGAAGPDLGSWTGGTMQMALLATDSEKDWKLRKVRVVIFENSEMSTNRLQAPLDHCPQSPSMGRCSNQ